MNDGAGSDSSAPRGVYIALLSIHGLVRGENIELGRDADTGGQVKYVVDLARQLGEHPDVHRVDLLTRRIDDKKISTDYSQRVEVLSDKANIVRIACGPRRYLRKETLWPYLGQFVENALQHFRELGQVPDVVHGHYADAGMAGSHLAALLESVLTQPPGQRSCN